MLAGTFTTQMLCLFRAARTSDVIWPVKTSIISKPFCVGGYAMLFSFHLKVRNDDFIYQFDRFIRVVSKIYTQTKLFWKFTARNALLSFPAID